MSGRSYTVRWTQKAKEMLSRISDKRIQSKLVDRADRLTLEPEQQGKPLGNELTGFRSVRAVGQRYRIIYTVERKIITVQVVGVGIRRSGSRDDIYEIARKLIKSGIL
ncbi:MAG: type II toxin-antitoxin system RelE/ParE family toxin [Deltaproteobacteria bacterium]|nr:type II toxin-antitoxin system RelE/ParE family toxin [Deltaproteobacteria bacterium]